MQTGTDLNEGEFFFLQDGGETGEYIRNYNWNATSIGSPHKWPQSLRTTLSILLNSTLPMFLFWGEEHIFFYNDAFLAGFGIDESASRLLGQSGKDCLGEIWPKVKPIINQVLASNESIKSEERLIPLISCQKSTNSNWSFTYNAVNDETGNAAGVIAIGNESRKIEESEQQVRSFVEIAPFPIGVYTGREMRIQFANQTILDTWGKGNDVIGRLYSEVLPELDNQEIFEQLDGVYTTGIPFHAKNQRVDLVVDGKLQPFYFNYSFTPLYDSAGKVYGVMNTAADVTDLNLAHRKIEESEKNLRNIILQAPVAMCILMGPQHVVEIANDRMFELWGRQSEDLLHKPIFKGLEEVKAQGFEELLHKVYTTGETVSAYGLPVTLPRNDKIELVYINFVYEAFRQGDGTIAGVMAVATDVTQQVVATKKIEEAEERARLAVASAELGTYEISFATNEIVASPRMAAIFNIENSADRERYITAIYTEDRKIRADAYTNAYKTGLLDYDGRVIWKDGSVHWLRVRGKVYYDSDNKPARVLGVVQDITEQKIFAEALTKQVKERTIQLESKNNELLAINEELEQFTYAASHDMQEPLRKVSTFSSLLLQKHADQLDERGKGYLSKISTSVQRMKMIINDLLNYSKQSSEQQQFKPVNLNKIIEDIETDLELVIQQKNPSIIKDALPQINAVPLQMNQLFFNLYSNALKFSKPTVPLQIQIKLATPSPEELSTKGIYTDATYIKISFSDNGIGFEQEYAERIFSLFKRLHPKNEFEGSGIGLGLCKKIVQKHKGAIWAESEPGKGSVFYILLPK